VVADSKQICGGRYNSLKYQKGRSLRNEKMVFSTK